MCLRIPTFISLAILLCVAAPAFAQSTDVEVQLDSFGVNNFYRPGEFGGIRLKLTSGLDEPTAVWTQIEIPNVDGDIAEYGRAVTLSPGTPTLLWLYAPLPPDMTTTTTWPVRVFRLDENRRRAEIGGARISPSLAAAVKIGIDESMIGVIGTNDHLGLRDYPAVNPNGGRPLHVNEASHKVLNIQVTDLPDRWEGLKQFEALAWAEASPRDLRQGEVEALREYVRRGGHFIIILPSAGDQWSLGVPGRIPYELEQLVPQTGPRRDVDVPLSDVLPVLAKAKRALAQIALSIKVFADLNGDFDAIDNRYKPLIALPDGRVVVIRRTVGHGWMTVIGIDIATQQLYSVPLSNGAAGLPQADRFWNRILGRRADTPTGGEISAMAQAKIIAQRLSNELDVGRGSLLASQIGMTRDANVGLLITFGLFLLYWIIAGPGGFAVLKMWKKTRHSWMAFAGAALVFTGVAWTLTRLRPDRVAVKHVTVLDHVYRPDGSRPEDPQEQRAISWFSLRLPEYGKTTVTIDNDDDRRDLLTSWTPPGAITQQFPNVDRYRVDVGREPARYDTYDEENRVDYELPSRSTATMLYANWMGGVDPEWGGFFQINQSDPVELLRGPDGSEVGLSGTIQHQLPGDLANAVVIWVRNARSTPRSYAVSEDREQAWVNRFQSGAMLNRGYMWVMSGPLESGVSYSLDSLLQDTSGAALLQRNLDDRYIEPFAGKTELPGSTTMTPLNQRRFMEMLSLFNQLKPPQYLLDQPEGNMLEDNMAAYRSLGRELDLSVWLTRPCLIIMGYVRDSELPYPLEIDGRKPPAEEGSVTMVRWIYPLPVLEDVVFSLEEETDTEPE